MQRETHQSKIISQMNMSPPSKSSFKDAEPVGEPFNARKRSSIDFSDLEIVLAKTRNPVLTQLHKTYLTQFDVMTQKIEALSREIDQLKAERARPGSRSSAATTPDLEERFDCQISLDVDSRSNSTSSKESAGSVEDEVERNWKRETPFWKRLLREGEEEEDWDSLEQGTIRRGSILRCVSPKTVL